MVVKTKALITKNQRKINAYEINNDSKRRIKFKR